jgi:hypothetical protein
MGEADDIETKLAALRGALDGAHMGLVAKFKEFEARALAAEKALADERLERSALVERVKAALAVAAAPPPPPPS